ncbi:hypothetical protein [Microbacterium sp. zg-YB36]|uniref:hypothetical protein n=1 Tax=Microbacterium sp. zg-YB36 TaxID=2969407 RepID=UPI00214B76C5|nr:hypothetical protein [Microbacterium sp. zg-YB36]MDL5351587.1 hypothetical protein [Microbacterium sp. zg-YB36]
MQADNLMAALLKIALDDKQPVAARLVAIRDGLDRANLSGTQAVELTVEKGRTFEDITSDVVADLVMDDHGDYVEDAYVVEEFEAERTPLVPRDPDAVYDGNRHDRRAFAEVEQGRAEERRRMNRTGLSAAERKRLEAEALAQHQSTSTSLVDPTIARAAYLAALDNGATTEEAEAAGRAAGSRGTGERRARTSEATMTDGRGERRKR